MALTFPTQSALVVCREQWTCFRGKKRPVSLFSNKRVKVSVCVVLCCVVVIVVGGVVVLGISRMTSKWTFQTEFRE